MGFLDPLNICRCVNYFYCTGGLFWECTLEDKVIPKLCKLKAGSVRVEVKLRKQNPTTWMLHGTNDSKVGSYSFLAVYYTNYVYKGAYFYWHACFFSGS